MIKFEVFSEEHDVRAKLDALGLNLDGLIEVADAAFAAPVSYTHLTLPTILLV